jgi:hypothetical protein
VGDADGHAGRQSIQNAIQVVVDAMRAVVEQHE